MKKKTLALLDGSGINAKTHPVLLSLLEMAAQGPGLGYNPSMQVRLARSWHKVAAAFRRCVAAGVTDVGLLEAGPFEGISYGPEGWRITASPPISYRDYIAAALDRAANSSGRLLKPFDIQTVEDLREAQRVNALPGPEAVIHGAGRLEGRLHQGRRCVVSWNIWGSRVFGLLASDEFGRLRVLGFRDSKREAMRLNDETPVAS